MKVTKKRVADAMAAADAPRMTRPAMWRIYEIHRAIMERRYPNCSTLGRELEVTNKTVQRDITFMRDSLRLPLEYDDRVHGYRYTEDVSEFPVFELTAEDLTGLFLARMALDPVKGTKLADEVGRVFARLTAMFQGEVRIRWSDLDRAFSCKAQRLDGNGARLFGKLAEAVIARREVAFHYLKLGATRHAVRRVCPYHLGEVDGGWYVIGRDMDRNAMRTFALPRISSLKVGKREFERPADFDGERYLMKSFGIWLRADSDERHLVRVELRDYAARIAQERRWHPTQELKRLNPEGTRVEVKFEVGGLEEVVRWVLGWGSKAKVLAPEALKAAVKREARLISEG